MSNPKCTQCGLVNFASALECQRCGAAFGCAEEISFEADVPADDLRADKPRGLFRRVLAGLALSAFVLLGWYVSLLESSAKADLGQRQLVRAAVEHIERSGFSRDAFLLRRLASYRTTDNWWNRWAGHADAYAATNFPFQVVTLYPDFFEYPADDVERAAILLHEARHLAGGGEEEAFASVWRDKAKLGWTRERYGQTRVWQNVAEFTRRHAPQLFRCGADGRQDCTE